MTAYVATRRHSIDRDARRMTQGRAQDDLGADGAHSRPLAVPPTVFIMNTVGGDNIPPEIA